MTFSLLIIITTFPDIFLNTSATPINNNSGFLLRGIDLHATKLSKDAQLVLFDIFVTYNFLTSSAIAFRRSDVPVPKHVETIILRYPSASSPDGPELPFALIVAFVISSSSMSSYTIGCISCIGPCSIACWELSFPSGCYKTNN